MRLHEFADRGGRKKSKIFADVLNGSPLGVEMEGRKGRGERGRWKNNATAAGVGTRATFNVTKL